jgi:hypothetical protein
MNQQIQLKLFVNRNLENVGKEFHMILIKRKIVIVMEKIPRLAKNLLLLLEVQT